jgi:hypothetical protein
MTESTRKYEKKKHPDYEARKLLGEIHLSWKLSEQAQDALVIIMSDMLVEFNSRPKIKVWVKDIIEIGRWEWE